MHKVFEDVQENDPSLWQRKIPIPDREGHKYARGHAVIYGAPELTGATRLAAESCARAGAGLVTILCKPETAEIYRASLPPHIMVRDNIFWHDARVTAKLYGPGGLSKWPDYDNAIPTVLDASALIELPDTLSENFVLTPHEGEFTKAFPDITGEREERALKAAQKTGAVIVLKGPETVIAHPDGRVVINRHASADLATAGTGDVLAGLITGFMAQGMDPFDAACASVWIHGDAAIRFGQGLVASDLPGLIPVVKQHLGI